MDKDVANMTAFIARRYPKKLSSPCTCENIELYRQNDVGPRFRKRVEWEAGEGFRGSEGEVR